MALGIAPTFPTHTQTQIRGKYTVQIKISHLDYFTGTVYCGVRCGSHSLILIIDVILIFPETSKRIYNKLGPKTTPRKQLVVFVRLRYLQYLSFGTKSPLFCLSPLLKRQISSNVKTFPHWEVICPINVYVVLTLVFGCMYILCVYIRQTKYFHTILSTCCKYIQKKNEKKS